MIVIATVLTGIAAFVALDDFGACDVWTASPVPQ
jgi:hypothetical protein